MNAWLRSEPLRRWVQDGLFVGLTVVLWLAGCVLVAAGAISAIFFFFSGASLHGFLLHLHNLTVRYVEAETMRQESFAGLAALVMAVLLVGVCVVRLPVLVRRLRPGRCDSGGGRT